MPRGSDKIKLTYSLVKTIRVHLSNTPETTNMPIYKKSIEAVKDPLVVLKRNAIRQILTKGTFYGRMNMRTIRCHNTLANTTKTNIPPTKKDT